MWPSLLKRKLTSAGDVLRLRGPIAFALEALANVLPRGTASWLRCAEHWWVGRLVEISGNLVTLEECRFSVDSPAVGTSVKSLLIFDAYEQPERVAVKRFLDPRLPVVELGGSIGVVSCLTNKMLDDPERHVVVEANPALATLLRRNRDRNGCRFTILDRALAYGGDTIAFDLGGSATSSLHVKTGVTSLVGKTSLEEILAEHGFGLINLICDIEGAEADLVENECDCLCERVKTLIVEVHPNVLGGDRVASMIERLESRGFEKLNADRRFEVQKLIVFGNSNLP